MTTAKLSRTTSNSPKVSIFKLVIASKFFLLDALSAQLERRLCLHIVTDNVCDLARFAEFYALPVLWKSCVEFVETRALHDRTSASSFLYGSLESVRIALAKVLLRHRVVQASYAADDDDASVSRLEEEIAALVARHPNALKHLVGMKPAQDDDEDEGWPS